MPNGICVQVLRTSKLRALVEKANGKILIWGRVTQNCVYLPNLGAEMRFFSLKTCDTCRKALKSLAAHDVEIIDVRADGVSPADRDAILTAFGNGALNTRSTTWRGLSEEERAKDAGVLLAAHPTLMKRPVIEVDGVWYQGWTAATKQALGVD